MDLILVGALPQGIEQMIHQHFSSFPSGPGERFQFPRNPRPNGPTILSHYAPDLLNHENPQESTAQLGVSLFAPSLLESDHHATNMLVRILGLGPNSRLFTSVSKRKGLAYGITAGYDVEDNRGGIYISGNIKATHTDEALDAIFEEMAILQKELVSQEDLERLKQNTRYFFAEALETNQGHVEAIKALIDEGLTPEKYLAEMEKVTPEEVRKAALDYFPESRTKGDYVLSIRSPIE